MEQRAGGDVRYWSGLAGRMMRIGRPDRALHAARRGAALAAADPDVRARLAQALAATGRWAEARRELEVIGVDKPAEVERLEVLAATHESLLQPEHALAFAERAVAAAPDDADCRHRLAALHRQLGRLGEAYAGAEAVLRLAPQHAGALWLRSDLAAGDHVDDLCARLGRELPPRTEEVVLYALGHELERQGRWTEAFDAIAAGAERVRRRSPPGLAQQEQARLQAAARAAPPPGPGCVDAAPIFVIGLPRTGTSLVERIIGAHPQVRTLGETPAFDRALADLAVGPGSRSAAELGRRYLAEAGITSGERTVDKRPLNMLNIDAITAALPRARIVLVERDPVDAGWALFKTLFADGAYAFSYDLASTGAYIAAHLALGEAWKACFPGQLLSIGYEDVVADVEAAARRVLAHCDLAWDPSCARPEASTAAATTASAVQVRRPVYRSSVGSARRLGEKLTPLRAALRAGGVDLASEGGGG